MSTWILRDLQPGSGPRVAVKDLIDMAGLPTTAGSRAVAETAEPAEQDAACLAGLRAAIAAGQARFAGKPNLHELAYGVTGINAAFGTPANPLDARLVPGGSSSGSAAAVGAEEADIAYGTDTGGSVRIPAACCGITGLKTTWGRVPLYGVRPLAPGFDTVGPMARDVAGVAAGMALLEPGFTVADSAPRTVGLVDIGADPAITAAVEEALRTAELEVQAVALPQLREVTVAALTVLNAQAWEACSDLYATSPELLGDDVRERLRMASAITDPRRGAAQAVLDAWKVTLQELFRQVELLAMPVLLGFPAPLEDGHAVMATLRGPTAVINAAGLPALAQPVPAGGPLPASLQLVGPARSEDRLLATGALVERAVAR